ncbi:hypothetical protein QG37_01531 [Candidozyma auris]|nr:hypothetical protein QG37_01531 [[Candida] auris]
MSQKSATGGALAREQSPQRAGKTGPQVALSTLVVSLLPEFLSVIAFFGRTWLAFSSQPETGPWRIYEEIQVREAVYFQC